MKKIVGWTTPEEIERELRRRNLRPWFRSKIVVAALAPFAILIHGVVGLGKGLRDGIDEVREAWRCLR